MDRSPIACLDGVRGPIRALQWALCGVRGASAGPRRRNGQGRRCAGPSDRRSRARARGGDARWQLGLENEQRELADFIRVGSTRGHQCFGSYFDDKGGSCALGAVYEGVYHLPRAHGKLIPDHLERLFRCLDEVTKPCPEGCKQAAAARVDDRALERRPSDDPRANRRVAHTGIQRLIESDDLGVSRDRLIERPIDVPPVRPRSSD